MEWMEWAGCECTDECNFREALLAKNLSGERSLFLFIHAASNFLLVHTLILLLLILSTVLPARKSTVQMWLRRPPRSIFVSIGGSSNFFRAVRPSSFKTVADDGWTQNQIRLPNHL